MRRLINFILGRVAVDDTVTRLLAIGVDPTEARSTIERIARDRRWSPDTACIVVTHAYVCGVPSVDEYAEAVDVAAWFVSGDVADLSAIFAKVHAQARLSIADTYMLAERGLPIVSILADDLDIDFADANRAVALGNVSAELLTHAVIAAYAKRHLRR